MQERWALVVERVSHFFDQIAPLGLISATDDQIEIKGAPRITVEDHGMPAREQKRQASGCCTIAKFD